MSYEVLLAVNKFTYVLCHYKEEMSSLEEERMKGDRLRPGIFFLADGWHENEAKWSPKMWVVRGLCCPLVELASDITSICPPWLHLLVLSFKESSFVDEIRLFCLCSMNAFYFTAQRSRWRHLEGGYKAGPGCSIKLCAKSKFSTRWSQRFSRKLSEKMLFNKQGRKKPRLKFNSVLALIGPSNNRALTTQTAVKWCETSQTSLKLRRKTENHSQLIICTYLKNFTLFSRSFVSQIKNYVWIHAYGPATLQECRINTYIIMTHVASPVINSVPLVVSVEMNTVNYKPRLTQRVLRFAVFRRRKFSNL